MNKALQLDKGFGFWLEKAIRVEEDEEEEEGQQQQQQPAPESDVGIRTSHNNNNNSIDWIQHTVDYGSFKARLRYFVQRRSKLRALLKESPDGKITNAQVDAVLWEYHNQQQQQEHQQHYQQQHYDSENPKQQQQKDGHNPQPPPLPSRQEMFKSMRSSSRLLQQQMQQQLQNIQHPPNEHEQQQQTQLKTADLLRVATSCNPDYYTPFPGQQQQHYNDDDDAHHHILFQTSSEDFADIQFIALDSPCMVRSPPAPTTQTEVFFHQQLRMDQLRARDRRKTHRSVMRRVSCLERNEMIAFLSWETEKAQLFYWTQWQRLSEWMVQAEQQKKKTTTSTKQQQQQTPTNETEAAASPGLSDAVDLAAANAAAAHVTFGNTLPATVDDPYFHNLANEILELICFCVINVLTVRQILIRYDAYARTFEGTPMLHYYTKHVMKKKSPYRKLLFHEELVAIADAYQERILNGYSNYNYGGNGHGSSSTNAVPPAAPAVQQHYLHQRAMFADILSSTEAAGSIHTQGESHRHILSSSMLGTQDSHDNNDYFDDNDYEGGKAGLVPSASSFNGKGVSAAANAMAKRQGWKWKSISMLRTVRDWYLLGAFEDRLGLEPAYLTMRGLTLDSEMAQIALWRENKHANLVEVMKEHELQKLQQHDDIRGHATSTAKQLSGMQVYHLTLNLLSGFLYCMNYYIVEPSSTMYCNRLGAHDAMSGTLIGMMPLAAFLSSLPFSMWTNKSFRSPFIMSCCLLILGNLVYSLADRFGAGIKMALLGRFICGLGAPKCIIRRYMADTTPLALRTSVNAGFGMVVAAGSAMGPAMAVLLNRVEYVLAVPYFGIYIFNGLTLPGYFMAMLWFTFTLIVLATFEEPDREGLLEQQAMERMGGHIPLSNPSSTSTTGGGGTYNKSGQATANNNAGAMNNKEQEELRSILSCDDLMSLAGGGDDGDDNDDEETDHSTTARTQGGCNNSFCRWYNECNQFLELITLPVRICLGLLFAKVFTIEALVSATSALTKNRYRWKVQQVGTLGFVNGLLVIPFSILVGRFSMYYQDHVLMRYLLALGCTGLFLLIDISDLLSTPKTKTYNKGDPWAVSPKRYIAGYFMSYLAIQSFEGVIGSTLSKVIPTALAQGTVNSGLLATMVDTFGRACGDLFISAMGYLSLRQLMNLLFIPTFCIMLSCLLVIQRYKDLLAV